MTKPKPFSRPRIDLTPSENVWQKLPAEQVRVDDIVADFGRVVKAEGGLNGVLLQSVGRPLTGFQSHEMLHVYGPRR